MPDTPRRATYAQMKRSLSNLLFDLDILSGDAPGNGLAWQEIAKTAAFSADVLARQIGEASIGNHEPFIVFPSPAEIMEANQKELNPDETKYTELGAGS